MASSYAAEEKSIVRSPSDVAHETDPKADTDVFEEQPDHDFHYKTLSWQVGLASS
jgi:hypothetical protein